MLASLRAGEGTESLSLARRSARGLALLWWRTGLLRAIAVSKFINSAINVAGQAAMIAGGVVLRVLTIVRLADPGNLLRRMLG